MKLAYQPTYYDEQPTFFAEPAKFPATRYQGSKLKLIDWIWDSIKGLDFSTALDAFGGTGSVSHMLKQHGKQVVYNDILRFNAFIGQALIENDSVKLSEQDILHIISEHSGVTYPDFIHENFSDIYFTDEENKWIDVAITNIRAISNKYKKALALFALFQSCIIKRPFNLFHRKNLYIRFSEVERNFGNKATWDKPFEYHFRRMVNEANRAVFSNNLVNTAMNQDVFGIESRFDLVYIDTPYISVKGSTVNYYDFYHFLEGLVYYDNWDEMIDTSSKHKRLKANYSVWNDKTAITEAFDRLFSKFRDSILVVSYRSDGIPSLGEIENIMRRYKKNISENKIKKYKYVLSTSISEEVLIIGT